MKHSLTNWIVTCGRCGHDNSLHYYDDEPKVFVCLKCEGYFLLKYTSDADEPYFRYEGQYITQ